MTKHARLAAALVFLAGSPPLFGNYPSARTEGMELVNAGRHEEAAEFFVRLAEGAGNPVQQSDALSIAAVAMAKAGRPEEAMELAARIPDPAMARFCRIKLLEEARQWQAVVESAGEIDLDAWPEKLLFPALLARAHARSVIGQHDQADSDLRLALDVAVSPGNQARAWYAMAQNAAAANAGPDQALAAYAQIISLRTSSGGMLQRALRERARLLSSLGRHDEALADLAELDQNNNNDPHWICATLIGHGEVFRDKGETDRARESFQQAAQVPNAPAVLIEEANKLSAALDGAISQPPANRKNP